MDEPSSPDYEVGGFRLDTALEVLIAPTGEQPPAAALMSCEGVDGSMR
jgi:hypothetical protein